MLCEQILAKIDAGLINPDAELGIKKGRENNLGANVQENSNKKEQSLDLKEEQKQKK